MRVSPCGLRFLRPLLVLLVVAGMASYVSAQQPNQRPRSERNLDPSGFPWPGGAKMALSLTFDDGRSSQVTHAVPVNQVVPSCL